MWFELLDIIDDDTFKAKLLSTPYNVDLKEGDIDIYKLNQVTNWTIYYEDLEYDPNNVYELE
jgi:hypothetical protein